MSRVASGWLLVHVYLTHKSVCVAKVCSEVYCCNSTTALISIGNAWTLSAYVCSLCIICVDAHCLYHPCQWQASLWHLVWYHLLILECGQAALHCACASHVILTSSSHSQVFYILVEYLCIILMYPYTLWQASRWYLAWYHLLECDQTTLYLLTHSFATTSTLKLPSTSAAPPLTQLMTSLCPCTRMGWWSVMGTWRTQHWQRQPLQPPRSLSSWYFSTSN